jgi:hypothetical protein
MKLCEKHDYDRRTSFSHAIPPFRPPPQPLGYFDGGHASAPTLPTTGPSIPALTNTSRSFDSSTAIRRPKIRSYKSHFKQRYLVETAWRTGGNHVARHITQDQGVVTSLHLTPKYIVVALDNAKIHVFNTEGNNQKTLQGHVMGVWAMVPWDDVLVSGGCDRDVRVWNMATGYGLHSDSRKIKLTTNVQGEYTYPSRSYLDGSLLEDVGFGYGHFRFAGYNTPGLGYKERCLQECPGRTPSEREMFRNQGRYCSLGELRYYRQSLEYIRGQMFKST